MSKEKLSKAIGEIDEKYIDEAMNYKSKKVIPFARLLPFVACFCIMFVAALLLPSVIKSNNVTNVKKPVTTGQTVTNSADKINKGYDTYGGEVENNFVVNKIKSVAIEDYAIKEVKSFIKYKGSKLDNIIDQFEMDTDADYYVITSSMPDGFELTDFYALYVENNGKKKLHDYVFSFDKGENNITINICPYEKTLSGYFVKGETNKKSKVNNSNVIIYGENSSYYVDYKAYGTTFRVDANGITEKELENMLVNIV